MGYRIVVEANKSNRYQKLVLKGADSLISDNLVPIRISSDGTVTKSHIYTELYNYENLEFANAVVLVDDSVEYDNGDVIQEENIESYFVWIARYKYKIFDDGSTYTTFTAIQENKE